MKVKIEEGGDEEKINRIPYDELVLNLNNEGLWRLFLNGEDFLFVKKENEECLEVCIIIDESGATFINQSSLRTLRDQSFFKSPNRIEIKLIKP